VCLQDLSFRYGQADAHDLPQALARKAGPDLAHDRVDRERCILCYRCTRFSQEVAEDEELTAVNRGALSMISTFEDEPYRGPFSGNVTELCPVGALTSTQYRFKARPWSTSRPRAFAASARSAAT